jgi:hypothetical protein
MALPELFANSPTPGQNVSLTTLNAAVTTTNATTITTLAAAPAVLQGAGQFRVIIDSEILIVTAGATGTSWTVVRGAEGSTAATHSNGTAVYHSLTADALNFGPLAPDALQNGVIGSGDGVVTGAAVASVTGVISGTMAAGTCWVNEPLYSALVRCAIPSGSFSLTPASLPATLKYAIVGVDLVAATAGAAPVLAASAKGADQTTQALALANPPATATGRVRLLDVVILNTVGVYTLSTTRDRRPWARGAYSRFVRNTSNYTTTSSTLASIDATNLKRRVECVSGLVRVSLRGRLEPGAGIAIFAPMVDGSPVDGPTTTAGGLGMASTATEALLNESYDLSVAVGSHQIEWGWRVSSGTGTLVCDANHPVQFVIEEIVRQNADNGAT